MQGETLRQSVGPVRPGLHGLPLGPVVFEALEKWGNPGLVPLPSPTRPPLFTLVPPRALSEPPGFPSFPQPRHPVPTRVQRRAWTHPPPRQGDCLRGPRGSRLRETPPVRGFCAPPTGTLVLRRPLAKAAAQTLPRCAGSFWRSSFCPACTAAETVERSTIEKNACREPSPWALSHHAPANNHREGTPRKARAVNYDPPGHLWLERIGSCDWGAPSWGQGSRWTRRERRGKVSYFL